MLWEEKVVSETTGKIQHLPAGQNVMRKKCVEFTLSCEQKGDLEQQVYVSLPTIVQQNGREAGLLGHPRIGRLPSNECKNSVHKIIQT